MPASVASRLGVLTWHAPLAVQAAFLGGLRSGKLLTEAARHFVQVRAVHPWCHCTLPTNRSSLCIPDVTGASEPENDRISSPCCLTCRHDKRDM